jgi:uncharacterized membrane protein YgdD (TMEM256/DUF423 family)
VQEEEMMARLWIILGALNGLIAVALGALGSHVLQDQLNAKDFENFELGLLYHLIHSLALVGAGMLARSGMPLANMAGIFFMAGIILFSGTLYSLGLVETTALGMVAPFGGASYMIGWLLITLGAFRLSSTE